MEELMYHPHFFTATILKRKPLLKPKKYKDLLIDSLRFLTKNKRVQIFSYVLMSSHIHTIWQIQSGHTREEVQRDFLKFTAQRIKDDLAKNHPAVMKQFEVNAKDRNYQFWKRNSVSIELHSERMFLQKMDYIHNNPVKAGLCNLPEEYKYSSALFYEEGIDEFGIVTHFRD